MIPPILPKKGTDPTPQTGTPAGRMVRGGPDAASAGAQQVLDRNAGTIAAFINSQRQKAATSAIPINQGQLSHPEFDIQYQRIQGTERITVTPKVPPEPAPEQQGQADEQPGAPNELPELLHTDKPGPDNPLCMMVLFVDTLTGVAQVGAIDMKELAKATVKYQGEAKHSQWTPQAGGLLKTLQVKLGMTDFLLWPLDITGTTAATQLWVSTNNLGDATATQADPAAMPVMNGSAQLVYTCGGSYTYSTANGFRLAASLPVDTQTEFGESRMAPHAIANDGTCYVLPQCTGSIPLGLSPVCTPTYTFSSTLSQQVSDKEQALQMSIPSVMVSYATVLFYTVSTDIHQSNDDQHISDDITVTGKTTRLQVGTKHPAPITGESYYGQALYGRAPTLQNYHHAEGDQDFNSYPGGVDYALVSVKGTVTALDNYFPLASYAGGALSVELVRYQYTELDDFSLEYDKTKAKILQAGAVAMFADDSGKVRTDDNPAHDNYTLTTWELDGFDPDDNPKPVRSPSIPHYTQGQIDSYAATVKASLLAMPGVQGHDEADMTELTLHSAIAGDSVEISSSGDVTFTSGSGPPVPPDSVEIGAAGSHGTTYVSSDSFSSKHFPYSYPTKDTGHGTTVLAIFGETLTATYDNASNAPVRVASMAVHSFPPMYQGKPYYTKVESYQGAPTRTVVSPYFRHGDVNSATSFTPWLHVSNGTHCIQGYYVDGVGYLFLDGSSSNYLVTLARALGCDPGGIVSMVMDVTLAKIKAVAGVKAPDYSRSSAGDPGRIAR